MCLGVWVGGLGWGLLGGPGHRSSWRGCGVQSLGESGGAVGLVRARCQQQNWETGPSCLPGSRISLFSRKEAGPQASFTQNETGAEWQIPSSEQPAQRASRGGNCVRALCAPRGCHALPPTVSKVVAFRVLIPQGNPVTPRTLGQGSFPCPWCRGQGSGDHRCAVVSSQLISNHSHVQCSCSSSISYVPL